MSQPIIQAFFDEPTNTVSYLVADPETKQAAVIDPVLDYDHKSGKARVTSAEAILARGHRSRASRSASCWRPTSMPTIFRVRPTSS